MMAGGGVVAALGAAVLAIGLGWPLTRFFAARWWRMVPCNIEHELVVYPCAPGATP